MASAAVISPARQRATTRSKLSGKGRGLRPVYLPCSLAIAILSLTLQDILTLQFCDRREHGEHKLAGWRGRVDGLFAADKLYMLFGQPFHEIEQVARVSRKAAD